MLHFRSFIGPRFKPIVFTLNTSDPLRCAGGYHKRHHSFSHRTHSHELVLLNDTHHLYEHAMGRHHITCGGRDGNLPPYVLGSVTNDRIQGNPDHHQSSTLQESTSSVHINDRIWGNPYHHQSSPLQESTLSAHTVCHNVDMDSVLSEAGNALYGHDPVVTSYHGPCVAQLLTNADTYAPSLPSINDGHVQAAASNRSGWVRVCAYDEIDEGMTVMMKHLPLKALPTGIWGQVDEYLAGRGYPEQIAFMYVPRNRGTVKKRKQAYCFIHLRSHVAASILIKEWHERMTFPVNGVTPHFMLAKVQGLESNIKLAM